MQAADPVVQRYARQQQQQQQLQQLPQQYNQKVPKKSAAVAPQQIKYLPQARGQPQQQQLVKHGDHYDVKDNEIDSLYAPADRQEQQQYFYPGEQLQGEDTVQKMCTAAFFKHVKHV